VKIFVVILNWNNAALTERCLRRGKLTTALAVQWVVVDNGSAPPFNATDDDVKVIRNDVNLGFTGGANIGLRYSFGEGADYVWLLNNDAEPLQGALEALISAAERDTRVGLASSVILDSKAEGKTDWHGTRWDEGVYQTTVDRAEYLSWEASAPHKICILGTALLVARRLIERVGYFDENLFAYWEDIDLSRRSLTAGFHNIVVPDSFVKHPAAPAKAGTRPSYYYYYMTRNELIISRKLGDPLRSYYWAIRRIIRWHSIPGLSGSQKQAIRRGLLHGVFRWNKQPRRPTSQY
jgi:GT2 family glycosyltransferase